MFNGFMSSFYDMDISWLFCFFLFFFFTISLSLFFGTVKKIPTRGEKYILSGFWKIEDATS